MNSAHLHLLFNHFPIIGTMIGLLVLITGFLFKGHPAIRQVALGIFVLSALVGAVAYFTGEGAEEVIESIGVANEAVVEEHEEAAGLFLIMVGVLGALSLFTFFLSVKNRKDSYLYIVVLVIACAVGVAGIRAGSTGGKVRHTEIGDTGNLPATSMPEMEEEDHD